MNSTVLDYQNIMGFLVADSLFGRECTRTFYII